MVFFGGVKKMEVFFWKDHSRIHHEARLRICCGDAALGICLSLDKGQFLCQKAASRFHMACVMILRRRESPTENDDCIILHI